MVKSNKKSSVEILFGPIASGKSTYCFKRASEGAIIINDDAIVNMLHGNNYTSYDKNLKPLYRSIENLIFNYAVSLGRDIVIDRPNFKKETRKRYILLAKSLDVSKIICIKFKDEGAKVHPLRRYKSSSRGYELKYWRYVYNKQKEKTETPSIDEGFSKIIEFKFSSIKYVKEKNKTL
jgi:predicted kinase